MSKEQILNFPNKMIDSNNSTPYSLLDITLLEGIFLFKNQFKNYFDLKIRIECPFETAPQRAILRSQENLSPEATVKACETIYFPAQKIHFAVDNPQKSADLIFKNP